MVSEERQSQHQASLYERRSLGHLWLISYADFMTIIMIFFLLMYGYAVLTRSALLASQQPQLSYSQFSEKMNELKARLGDELQIRDDVNKVVLQLSDKILFASGRATLNPEAVHTLEELSDSLKLVEGDIVVEGHTDDVPVKGGRYKSNWELSAARAFSVIAALTKSGVPPERLSAWGFGENRPLRLNINAQNRAANRRIEMILLKKVHKEAEKSHA